jgi:hypothetical protein
MGLAVTVNPSPQRIPLSSDRRGRSSLSPQGPPGGTRQGQTQIPFPPRRRRRRPRSSQPPEPHASANSSNLRPCSCAANHPQPLIKKPSRYRAYLRSTVTGSQTWEAPFSLWANLYTEWSFTLFPRSYEPVPTRRLRNYRVRGRPPYR